MITFDATNIKQYWIDKTIASINGHINILYRKKVDDEWHFAIKRDGKVITYAYIKI